MNNKKHLVYFNTRDELTRVCLDDVMFITSDGNYVILQLKSGRSVELLASMQNIEQVLNNESDIHFERVGRSHIINIAFLSQVNSVKRTILLADEETKENVTLAASKDSIKKLKQILVDIPKTPVPDFTTHNGNMEAFKYLPPAPPKEGGIGL